MSSLTTAVRPPVQDLSAPEATQAPGPTEDAAVQATGNADQQAHLSRCDTPPTDEGWDPSDACAVLEWLVGDTHDPKVIEPELVAVLAHDPFTRFNFDLALALIDQLPAKQRAPWQRELQARPVYRDQRDNEDPLETERGGTCNLTALAMCLDTLGVPNPHPDMQYEDALNKVRRDHKLGESTSHKTWVAIAAHLGVTMTEEPGGTFTRAWFESTLAGWLTDKAVMVSLGGHVARIEGVTDLGLLVDDPYGASVLKPRIDKETGQRKPYSWGPLNPTPEEATKAAKADEAAKAAEDAKADEDAQADDAAKADDAAPAKLPGDDHTWPWAQVEKYAFQKFFVLG